MSMDFNDAEPQGTGGGSVIPDGTVAPVVINVRGIVTSKNNSAVKGLDLEFSVIDGPFKGRKAWKWAGFKGTDSEGHKQMVSITRSFIRGILESAHGIDPADDSAEAMTARKLSDWEDLSGVSFLARFGVEAGTDFTNERTGVTQKGKDKNTIFAVTPDDPDYAGFKPAKPRASAPGAGSKPPANGGGIQRPAFAR